MKCTRCSQTIPSGAELTHLGQVVCEECCMELRSRVRTCDPWAVHSAQMFERHAGVKPTLTPMQERILHLLAQSDGLSIEELLARLDGALTRRELENQLAALRHMERTRAEKRGDKVIMRLW